MGPPATCRQSLLHRKDIDAVIVQGMKRCRGGRGHPGAIGARLGVIDLLLQHCRHHVGGGPHALADLRLAGQSAFEANIDVEVFIGVDPALALDEVLAAEWACFHRGVDFIAGAVKETGVDEGHAVACGANALLQVHRGAALLIHDAELYGVLRQAQHPFHAGENLVAEGHFLRPVHLRFHYIDRAVMGIAAAAFLLQVVKRNRRGDHSVHQAFGNFCARVVENGRRRHEVADIAHPKQRLALKQQRLAIGRGEFTVRVQAAHDSLAALLQLGFKVALHQAKPVGISQNLVLGVHAGHRVFAIHDGRKGALNHHIGEECLILAADEVGAGRTPVRHEARCCAEEPSPAPSDCRGSPRIFPAGAVACHPPASSHP